MNVEIRIAGDADADALGLITVSASLATFLGRVPEHLLDLGWTPRQSANGWRKALAEIDEAAGEFLAVAESDGDVIGFVWAGIVTGRSDFRRSVRGLYVLPSRQREGVGTALVSYVARRMADLGEDSLLIGCVKENPSCDFYRRLGGSEAFREPQYVDRFETEEIFFGWSSLDGLV